MGFYGRCRLKCSGYLYSLWSLELIIVVRLSASMCIIIPYDGKFLWDLILIVFMDNRQMAMRAL